MIRIRSLIKPVAASVMATLLIVTFLIGSAEAAFDKNNLISDPVFNQKGSMSAGQIDAFLNARPHSCISTNRGFAAKKPTGYSPSTGFQYGSYVSAGNVIHAAAQAYDLNPRVLIVTLEKEQSLITGRNNFNGYCLGSEHKYAAATGYGCPDSGGSYSYSGISLYRRNGVVHSSTGQTCVNSKVKAGFSQQVIRAAWLLKFGQQRSLGNVGWAIIRGNWDNSDDPQSCYSGPMTQGIRRRCPSGSAVFYDGLQSIDGQTVRMTTGATAALYWYTPHLHGNQNFVALYENWFGSTRFGYAADIMEAKLYTDADRTNEIALGSNVASNVTLYATITVKNTGSKTWDRSFLKVGTRDPANHSSPFSDSTWLSSARPTRMEHLSVASGLTTFFNFTLRTPKVDESYVEKFQLVAEGKAWLEGSRFNIPITVSNPYNAKIMSRKSYSDSSYTQKVNGSAKTGEKLYWKVLAKNIGTSTWDNTIVKVGTASPFNRTSDLADGSWLSSGRPAQLKESSVAPGQIGTFEYTTTGTAEELYSEGFSLLAEEVAWMPNGVYFNNIKVSDTPDQLLPGERLRTGTELRAGGRYLVLQGDGNLVLYENGKPLWNKSKANQLVLQGDGNLVLYKNGRAIWNRGPGNRLVLQGDGNLVLYKNGRAVWNTGTHR